MYIPKEKIRELIDSTDIRTVIDYLGISYEKKGSAYFLLCPNPEHNDHKNGNCFFRDGDRYLKCMACGYSANAIFLLKDVLGISFLDAVKMLCEITGRMDLLKEREVRQKRFFLSREEADTIGIKLPSQIKELINELDDLYIEEHALSHRELDACYDEALNIHYLLTKNRYLNWFDLVEEKVFIDLIIRKSIEKRTIYEEMRQYPFMTGIDAWKEACSAEIIKINAIIKKCRSFQ